MSEIRSWRRYAHEKSVEAGVCPSMNPTPNGLYTVPCQLTVLDHRVDDINCPPVGTEVMRHGDIVTIKSPPVWDEVCGCARVLIQGPYGYFGVSNVSDFYPTKPKRFQATFEGSEDEIRERHGFGDDVVLEEADDE